MKNLFNKSLLRYFCETFLKNIIRPERLSLRAVPHIDFWTELDFENFKKVASNLGFGAKF